MPNFIQSFPPCFGLVCHGGYFLFELSETFWGHGPNKPADVRKLKSAAAGLKMPGAG